MFVQGRRRFRVGICLCKTKEAYVCVMQRSGAGALSYGIASLDLELESFKDLTYVALEQAPSEDEDMESEFDGHIQLEDIKHPTNSHRTK